MHDSLFTPVTLGAIEARNRIALAPMTRGRSDESGMPNALMADYYAQRAGAGLIITEATSISTQGHGWPNAPGIWHDAHAEGWKPVTEEVHAAGGKIVLQLWHMGRIVSSAMLGGEPPLSASATQAPGEAWTYSGKQRYDLARPMTKHEIAKTIADYAAAGRRALNAGFDGVQLHGANGYLIDQFLRDGTNQRTDEYGDSVQNRCRLLREVLEALVAECGAGRVSVRYSPNDGIQGCVDSDPDALFAEAARVAQALELGFVELRDPGADGTFGKAEGVKRSPLVRSIYTGPLMLNADYDAARAEADIVAGRCDAVSFGRPYITNPDLAERIRSGAPLAPNADQGNSWYTRGAEGYTDYPAMAHV